MTNTRLDHSQTMFVAIINGQLVVNRTSRLDNGGDGTFNNLTVSLQLTDKSGAVLEKGTLDVQPFGDISHGIVFPADGIA